MTRTLIRSMAAVAASAAALAAASPAVADSIAYVKDGDVFLTTPDTSRTVQVTTSGGYTHVSQADDGTLMGLHGRRLHRISPRGALLADFATPVSGDAPTAGDRFDGPFDPAISPDGTKVAYAYYWTGYDASDPNCRPPTCVGRRTTAGVGYSHADRETSWDEPGMGYQSGWTGPSWIDDSRVLLSDKAVRYGNLDVIVDAVGSGLNEYTPWFDDTMSWYMRDGEMNLARGVMAFVGTTPNYTKFADDQIRVYRLNGDAPALPEACYAFVSDGTVYTDPSIAPDGRHVVWTDLGKGVMIGQIPDMSAGCAEPSQAARVLIPDAVSPDWGPADVPAAAGAPGGGAPTAPVTHPGGGSRAGGHFMLTRHGTGRLRPVLSTGLRMRVAPGAPGRVTLVATRNGRRVAAGTVRVGARGIATARLAFTRPARRALAGRPSVRLKVTAVFRPAAGAARRSTVAVTLRR